MLLDSQGFAIPRVDLELDHLTDHLIGDPDEGPPEDWPAWTDEISFGTDEEPEPDEEYPALEPDMDTPPEPEFPGVISPDLARLIAYSRID